MESEKNGKDIKEIIHTELFEGFSEARNSFISHFEQEINDFIAREKELFDILTFAVYTTIPDAYMPIPDGAIETSFVNGKPTLTQNPGYPTD